ncbi:MAG: acyl-ACP desaturase [Acidimicrobiales bacterium]
MDGQSLVHELTTDVAKLMERHLESSREWFPHEMIPWSRGRDFIPGEEWDPSEFPLTDAVRSALFVNLLTEDNLPYYFNTLAGVFGNGVWGEWARRWTAEEHRHSIVLRDYITVTRMLDPVMLERARMRQVSGGIVPEPEAPADALVYVTLQELATRVAHRNTGKLIGDPVGYAVMARVAADENMHHLFYRDLTSAALAVDPSGTMMAIDRQVRNFAMPGTGIENFAAHSAAISKAGIYDFGLHYDQVVAPVLTRHWRVEEVSGLDAEGEAAQTRVLRHLKRLGIAARRLNDRRSESLALASS